MGCWVCESSLERGIQGWIIWFDGVCWKVIWVGNGIHVDNGDLNYLRLWNE